VRVDSPADGLPLRSHLIEKHPAANHAGRAPCQSLAFFITKPVDFDFLRAQLSRLTVSPACAWKYLNVGKWPGEHQFEQ
jgi:hypothetical protein